MKKLIFLSLLVTLFAASSEAFNTTYSPLKPGNKVHVDVDFNKNPTGSVVSLTLDTVSKDASAKPVVKVVS